jgi:UDPglucose 6-dehydrogenase
VDVVTSALGLDSRIGAKYLKGAVSYGGPCFPRDNRALAALARGMGAPAELAQATDNFNRAQVIWLAELVGRHAKPGGAAGILGLTYKPQTDVVEEAVGFLLARELASRGFRVCAFDPAGMANARRELGDAVFFASTVAECIERSEVVVVATPWKEFLEIPAAIWGSGAGGRVVVDCWRGLKHIENVTGIRYLSLGIGAVDGAGDFKFQI